MVTSEGELLMPCRKALMDVETWWERLARHKDGRNLITFHLEPRMKAA